MRQIIAAVVIAMLASAEASAQRSVRLPASFYDIELRGSMLDGSISRMGNDGSNRPVAAAPRGNGMGGGIVVPENSGVSRFIITRDSLLFRNGRDRLEIAIADFISVSEASGQRTPHIVWVHVRYRHPDGERDLYMRRYSTRQQGALREAVEAAMAQSRSETRTP